jgi:hypothetical protein
MSQFSPKVSLALALVAALSLTAVCKGQAQGKLVPVSNATSAGADAESSRGVPDHLISAHVRDGVLTIDGLVAKVQLNYDIQRTGYMYFFVPGVGTAVVSMAPLAGGAKVADAFDGEKLAFSVEGHSVELASATKLLAKGKKADVYVRLDQSTVALSRYPRMGYGDTVAAPYVWPLSNPELAKKEKVEYVVPPPPVPRNLLPETASNH